jgi:hypothetical protein
MDRRIDENEFSNEPRRRTSARELVTEWLSISDLWLQPDPDTRDEPHLLWLEREVARDLSVAAAEGRFTEEDKIRLRAAFGEAGRAARDPEAAKLIQQLMGTLE